VPEEDLMDLNLDFNSINIEPEGDLDESGIERVPMADPGMDVRLPSFFVSFNHSIPI
jgi:serine/threonine-protein phosphatase 2A regulatory subunit B'